MAMVGGHTSGDRRAAVRVRDTSGTATAGTASAAGTSGAASARGSAAGRRRGVLQSMGLQLALLPVALTAAHGLQLQASAAPAHTHVGRCQTWYDATQHGSSFASAAAFGAKPDGRTDATAAIQAALDQQRGSVGAKRKATVYLPPGEYLVSDTLLLWAATTFVGSSSAEIGCRSTLVLADGAAGFGNAAGRGAPTLGIGPQTAPSARVA